MAVARPPRGSALAGTSGWVYRHLQGRCHPPDIRGDALLPSYAARLPTVEVNYSFYYLTRREVFSAWRTATPDELAFAVKPSRYLTHMMKLRDAAEPLDRLMELRFHLAHTTSGRARGGLVRDTRP